MRRIFFVTHADVIMDPVVPVTDWQLSARGTARHRAFARACPPVGSVFSSFERKAMDGADILAEAQGLVARRVASLHENDRSATGYLPPAEFEAMADAFFAHPRDSQRGWERAIDAQARVVMTLRRVVAEAPSGDIAVVAHGGIGALLRAHLRGVGIDRSHDQPAGGGGGHLMVVSLPDWRLLQDWTRIEDFAEAQA
ncbi:histidine phosphatase superfamily (branch 1) [Antarctobacter heliothermus]|uniref:Histidine phosphatase superfamily (Branch 1) n=2 Tax=Antarctobacter heliothermus TaxID=74033 RepID=A0A222E948_9RHOB|nr:histidine phosphatase superfamily (branch 1) [Antarctobacter heliothermus]